MPRKFTSWQLTTTVLTLLFLFLSSCRHERRLFKEFLISLRTMKILTNYLHFLYTENNHKCKFVNNTSSSCVFSLKTCLKLCSAIAAMVCLVHCNLVFSLYPLHSTFHFSPTITGLHVGVSDYFVLSIFR